MLTQSHFFYLDFIPSDATKQMSILQEKDVDVIAGTIYFTERILRYFIRQILLTFYLSFLARNYLGTVLYYASLSLIISTAVFTLNVEVVIRDPIKSGPNIPNGSNC